MFENRAERRHSKCRVNGEKLLHLLRFRCTGDDTATVIGICVSLLIVLAGTFGYIFCVGQLITLVRVLVPLANFLKMQTCP
jgi:hypothetical protein